MLNQKNTLLLVVDVQGKLARMVYESEKMIKQLTALIQGIQILDIPIVWVEQYPKGLGPTIEEIKGLLVSLDAQEKITFSAYKNDEIKTKINSYDRKNIILTGIESHICVYQTGADLIANNYHVEIVEDAISSRAKVNKDIGLKKLNQLGAFSTSVEMVLFELMQAADIDQFKEVSQLIK